MDMLLLAVTAASLGLAACMTFVAWHLRRDAHRRSNARVAVLESLAFGDSGSDDESSEETAPPVIAAAPVETRQVAAPIEEAADDVEAVVDEVEEVAAPGPSWDAALGAFPRHTTAHQPVAAVPVETHARVAPNTSLLARDDSDADMFQQTVTTSPRSRRVLVLAAVAVVMIAGIGAAYIIRGGVTWPSFSTNTGAEIRQAQTRLDAAPLELLSLRHTVAAPGQFTVTGLVQNPHQGRAVSGLVAVVYLFDGQGRYLASGKTPIEYTSLGPGDEAPFVVTITATGEDVSRYRVGFRLEDGAVVSHVDRRGQPPASTTGEAIDSEPPSGRPRRAEGN